MYPAAGDYYKAVQAPSRSFTVPKLQAAEFVWDSLGPTLARGSSAVVFQASVEGKPQALRCYIRNDASSRDRYSALDAYLAGHDLSPYVSGTTWLDGAIMVNRATWPVLTMDWIDGRTLNEYVDFLVTGSNTAALTTLAARWRELVALLQRSEFAHGDLQHGNVMVDQEGQLRLVDFDGVWIPQLAGQSPPTEFGHPNYQHPVLHVWDRWLDTFSALVIYLSLTALGKDPGLWLALYNSKNLLFAKNDFFPPFKTEAWKQLAALGDPQVDELARRLQECCDPDWVSAKSLEMTLDRQAGAPVRPPIPAEQRWWEQKPASGPGPRPRRRPGPGPRRPRPRAPPPRPRAARRRRPRRPAAPPPRPLPSRRRTAPGARRRPRCRLRLRCPRRSAWRAPDRCRSCARRWCRRATPSGGPRRRSAPRPGSARAGIPRVRAARAHAPGYAPHGPGRPRRAARARIARAGADRPAAPATKPRPGPVVGAIALGLGIVLLIIGAAGHVAIVVIGGLVAAAWGMWRLVTGTGNNAKPPGQT